MDRISKIQNKLFNNDSKINSAIIVSKINRKYFTEFNSSWGYLFITKNTSYFLVDFRYIEAAKVNVKNCEIILLDNIKDNLAKLIKENNINGVFFEHSILLSEFKNLKSIFESNNVICDSSETLDTSIRNLRMIKSQDEINSIKISQKITEEAFNHIINKINVGISEKEIAFDLEFYMRKIGAEKIAFDLIVVSGNRTSAPHGTPSDKIIQKGDFVTIDIGSVYNGYNCDMTRTIAISNVNDEQKKIYNIVLNAQNSAINAIAPGVKCSNIDKIARDIISSNGYKKNFGHSTGHSLGIEIHESPYFSCNCEINLSPYMIMTVEPGIYINNKFGVRIEDMILVNESGFENLTNVTKELIII